MDLLIAAADTKRMIEECIGPSEEPENRNDFVIPVKERRFPCKVCSIGAIRTCIAPFLCQCGNLFLITILSFSKARGMHTEHTVTGFLTLPQGAIHGQDLFCTSRECFLEGVKFKYCATCDKAVAKRNFKKRHSHDYEEGPTSTVFIGSKHSFSPYASSDSSVEIRDTKQLRKISANSIDNRFTMNQSHFNLKSGPSYDTDGSANKEIKRESPIMWSDLYFSRPEDSNSTEMHEWLIRVIAASKPMTKPTVTAIEEQGQHMSDQQYSSLDSLQPLDLNSHQSGQHDLSIHDDGNSKEDLRMTML